MSTARLTGAWPILARALVFAAMAVFGWTLCRRGIILSDEGYLLEQAREVAEGALPYTDLDSFVAPGAWFTLAAAFRLFGASVLVSRVVTWLFWMGSFLAGWRITGRLSGLRASLSFAAVWAVSSVWAFPIWTTAFYSAMAITCSLWAFERLLAWRERPRLAPLVATGAALAAAVIFKQNYGVLAIAGCGLACLVMLQASGRSVLREFVATAVPVSLGALLVVGPLVGFYVIQGALPDMWHALVVAPFSDFASQHGIAHPGWSTLFDADALKQRNAYTYGSQRYLTTQLRHDLPAFWRNQLVHLHMALYWMVPAVVAGLAASGLADRLRRRDGGDARLGLAIFAGLVWLGLFPRADYNHLLNIYPPALVAAVVAVSPGKGDRRRRFRPVAWAAGALLSAYAVVAVAWYADLLRHYVFPVFGDRGGVVVDFWTAGQLAAEVEKLQTLAAPGEPVLALPGLSMLNFLAERPAPGRYNNFYAVHVAHDGGAEVVAESEAAGIDVVVTEARDFFSDDLKMREYAPVLIDYVRRWFEPRFLVARGRHIIHLRRSRPLPERFDIDVLGDCDARPNQLSRRTITDFLLDRTLVHRSGADARELPESIRTTSCRVRIPREPVVLAWRFGVYPPAECPAPVRIRARIVLADGPLGAGDGEPLWDESFEVEPNGAWLTPAPREFRVDLSAYGGETRDLLFTWEASGPVVVNTLQLDGFGVYWQDPRLESPGGADPGAPGVRRGHPQSSSL
jgi:hypothetical protein